MTGITTVGISDYASGGGKLERRDDIRMTQTSFRLNCKSVITFQVPAIVFGSLRLLNLCLKVIYPCTLRGCQMCIP